ncbi:MAG: FAD-binding oxidoreductase [Actinobacteria bacterium]|nr:FAD-binding oxidoreductase [Actinomycetota bacterium]
MELTDKVVSADGINELRARLTGALITPGDGAYDEARQVWNGMVDKHPAAVVRAADDADVSATVRFAAEHELLLAVRGGGHSVAGQGTCDGGIVLDLKAISHVDVDAEAGITRAGGGCLLGDVDRANQAQGRVVPAGVVSHTGAGGLTLGGGVGWLSRRFGLTCDNVAAFRVVLANGEVATASEDENPDLYWGLRGGGGNFGVVTEFSYRSHPFPTEIPVGIAFWPIKDAAAVLRVHAELMPERPNEWKATAFVSRPHKGTGVPPELIGQPCLSILQVWAGEDLAAAEEAYAPLRRAATPAFERLAPMSYIELQTVEDEVAAHGKCNYTKGGYLDRELGEGAIESLLTSAEEILNEESIIEVIPHGGAQLDLADADTAFPDREAAYSFNVYARWPLAEDDERHIAWVRRSFDGLDRHAGAGVYVNFFNPDEGDDGGRVLAAFGRERYDKLAQLKARYDPTNLFSLNPNVKPAATA